MKYLVNAFQMKAIDEYSIEKTGMLSLVLMEKAAMACARVVMKYCRECSEEFSRNNPHRFSGILAVCGMGNNGGDGVAAARILREAGLDASVLLVGEEDKASDQMKKQLEIGRNLNLPVFYYKDNNVDWNEYNIIIDGIFGIGLSKPIEGVYKNVIEEINNAAEAKETIKVFSVDIPSGIDANTGRIQNIAIKADYTITFGYNKIGMVLYPGKQYAGKVIVEDIGFARKAVEEVKPDVFCYEKHDKNIIPKRNPYSNKGTYGKVLIIGGSKNMSGAAYFAGKSAYITGAGLVKIFTAEKNRVIYQTGFPEGLLATFEEGDLSEEQIEKEINWATVIIIGPGMGVTEESKKLLQVVLKKAVIPVVIDADALTILAEESGLEQIKHHSNVILTPHLKEMTRLAGCSISDIKEDMVGFCRQAVKEKDYVLILKDARTLIVNQSKVCINMTGNSGMAVGGSGDVLSGVIGGLLAQGMDTFNAASMGVYLHGLGGDRGAGKKGEYGLLPEDIIEGVLKELKERGNRVNASETVMLNLMASHKI